MEDIRLRRGEGGQRRGTLLPFLTPHLVIDDSFGQLR